MNRKKVPAAAVIGTIGAVLIATHGCDRRASGARGLWAPIGVTSRWAFSGSGTSIVRAAAGVGRGLHFGPIGGVLLTYAIVLAVLPDLLPGDR